MTAARSNSPGDAEGQPARPASPAIPTLGVEWLRGDGPFSDVVLSSRIRLARNFAGFKFVSRCARAERAEVVRIAREHIMTALAPTAGLPPSQATVAIAEPAVPADQAKPPRAAPKRATKPRIAEPVPTPSGTGMMWIDLNEIPDIERLVLVERHLISQQHAKGAEPRAVAISVPDERLSIMVNEEDHLRVQVIRAGLALTEAFTQITGVDDTIESRADLAFSPRWGYLTACPTNVGTGIRVSVMLHLPGLKLTGEIEKVKRAAGAMNLAIRGFYGEGSEAFGDLFQVSNQTTLGKCEKDILAEFEHGIIPRVVDYERVARRTLIEKRRIFLDDQLYRAMGTLRHARLMKSDEAMQALSLVRLGACLGVFPDIAIEKAHEMMLLTQPAHLQRLAGRELDQAERRVERARLLRESLGGR